MSSVDGTAVRDGADERECPSCHTTHGVADTVVIDWQCARCGQQWTSGRLANVAAYGRWAAERHVAPAPVTSSAGLRS